MIKDGEDDIMKYFLVFLCVAVFPLMASGFVGEFNRMEPSDGGEIPFFIKPSGPQLRIVTMETGIVALEKESAPCFGKKSTT